MRRIEKVNQYQSGQDVEGIIYQPDSFAVHEIHNSDTGEHAALVQFYFNEGSVIQVIFEEDDVAAFVQVFCEVLPILAKNNHPEGGN